MLRNMINVGPNLSTFLSSLQINFNHEHRTPHKMACTGVFCVLKRDIRRFQPVVVVNALDPQIGISCGNIMGYCRVGHKRLVIDKINDQSDWIDIFTFCLPAALNIDSIINCLPQIELPYLLINSQSTQLHCLLGTSCKLSFRLDTLRGGLAYHHTFVQVSTNSQKVGE